MENIKILQIIPAPTGMRAVHEFDGKETEIPSVCGFDVFGGPVDLEDIEARLNWMEEGD